MNNLHYFIFLLLAFSSCQEPANKDPQVEIIHSLNLSEAEKLVSLPLDCIGVEYPNRLGQTLGDSNSLKEPHELHPAFYGCFDWHSAVHGHWSLIKLIKDFPSLQNTDSIKTILSNSLSEENILKELAYFEGKHNNLFERTYGWAWLLKISQELHTWDDPFARKLEDNLSPLSEKIADMYISFLPNLHYPVRVGTHSNTAFGLTFAWDYAIAINDTTLLNKIDYTAKALFMEDKTYPISWEPSGYDFLSPCLSEIDLMRRILTKTEFDNWIEEFLPEIKLSNFHLEPGIVKDRTDGLLVHLDGVNFSRAWVLYGLANQYEEYSHLNKLANEHIGYSISNLFGDGYEGGHWLGSFAIYALDQSK